MSTPQMIPMIAPDGSSGMVPSERVNEALKNGGQLGVAMQAPDGSYGVIPRTNLVTAIRAGGHVIKDSANYQISSVDKPAPEGNAWDKFVRSFGQNIGAPEKASDFVTGPLHAVTHPVEDAKLLITSAAQAQNNLIDRAYTEQHSPGVMSKVAGVVHGAESAIPLVGPALAQAGDYFDQGEVAKGLGATAGLTTAMVAGSPQTRANLGEMAADVRAHLPSGPNFRGALADRMQETPTGSQFTRQEVLDAAREHNVNLDVAQATDHPVAKGLRKVNRYSLTGSGEYDANATQNLQALSDWASQEASKYAPESGGREAVGGMVQKQLQDHLAARQELAQGLYDQLDQKVGGIPNDVSGTVQKAAADIVKQNGDYYASHPELKPTKAWAILEDLAEKPEGQPIPKKVGGEDVIDASGRPVMSKTPAGGPKIMTWSEMHQLRSDLMDFYRNNPDVIKGRSEGWIKQMVGNIDDAMTNASAGLSESDLSKFRQANQVWESIKNTYDNPQSPYYHAIRAGAPSQVTGMLSNGTPELARSVRNVLGSLEGPFQRQFVENILNDKAGNLDLTNLNSRLNRVPNDMLESMVGPEGARNLRMLGKIAQKVVVDYKGSQTAERGTPIAEALGIFAHPVAGVTELATQKALSKGINSPKVVDYLTKKP